MVEHAFLYAFIDGKENPDQRKLIRLEKENNWYTLAESLPDGEHSLKLVKRTEAIFSQSAVELIEIQGESPALLSPPKAKEKNDDYRRIHNLRLWAVRC